MLIVGRRLPVASDGLVQLSRLVLLQADIKMDLRRSAGDSISAVQLLSGL